MTANTAKVELHTALYAKLTSNNVIVAALSSLGFQAVYNIRGVPSGTKPQYILIGDTQEMPKNAFGRKGYALLTSIHLFTRDNGTFNADKAVDYLNGLFDQPQQPLVLATLTVASMMYNMANGVQDNDGLTWHLTLKYDIFIQ